MEEEAIEVLERLVSEDDGSVEAWYLGGWCSYLMGDKRRKGTGAGQEEEEGEGEHWTALMVSSREWLNNSLKLYHLQEYEDDRLRDHALELVETLNVELGNVAIDEEGDGGEWEDEEEDEEGENEEEDDNQEGGDLKMNGT